MSDPRFEYIRNRKMRSDELFADALLLAENQSWRSCINRLYYSVFHLVTALLNLDNINARTHEGLKSKFLQQYIKTEIISVGLGKAYSKILDWRLESDYSIISEFSIDDVEKIIEEVKQLREKISLQIDAKQSNIKL